MLLIKDFILSISLTPFALSTPLEASTANGFTWLMASATLSGFRPPARITGKSISTRARDQSKDFPVPP